MLRLFCATNWQDGLIEKLNKKSLCGMYGKLGTDFIGGGRFSAAMPICSKKVVKTHVELLHKNGLDFNYLLNTTCMEGLEHTRKGQKQIRRLLDWLQCCGVDGVTVAMPYLAKLIKTSYPELKVEVSSFAGVDNAQRAKRWEDLGVDCITLLSNKINRDFKLLEEIRKYTTCELQLIANNCCLYSCGYCDYHANSSSHASQQFHRSRYKLIDPYRLTCIYRRIKYQQELISAPWIRPEDLSIYEDIGIGRIKLVDRQMTTEALCRIVEAYTQRKYEGNLYDLFPGPSKSITLNRMNLLKKSRYFLVEIRNLPNVLKLKKLIQKEKIYLDNSKLDGFIDFFKSGKCTSECEKCGHCGQMAERALKIDNNYQQNMLKTFDDIFKDIFD